MDTLQELRDKTGMTQADVAERVGISENAYYLYERGKRIPRADKANAIAKTLGSTVDAIWGGEKHGKDHRI